MTDTPAARPQDDVDRALIAAVQADGRATLAKLAETIRLSVSATRSRLRSLEEHGVIRDYRARVEPEALGYTLRAIVRMKVHGSLYDKVAAILDREPQIVRCLRVTGESCYVMEIVATGMSDLERITSELARVGSITTDLVYEIVVDRPTPLPGAPRRVARATGEGADKPAKEAL
ncbi:Lrp/AsnC family transcriptional regulator [Nonomuraea jiangxiensis]|uniref:Lrp/AsnC family transcriptional regulator, leucine-responsive regulatory protein n=1 Tax=Nonomuraea jiangxiensis TaxID=633440 RepID=A0A1G9F6S3_9ACTN|nr:Lrp/AsnC family transcriptional regulator [Nonomuraea jiangxiensis]SDK84147.1 Lrp/AsnC family transcriptional regulator, leucine-responsive regulatory protein [Nonomuraea jiangxiensis]